MSCMGTVETGEGGEKIVMGDELWVMSWIEKVWLAVSPACRAASRGFELLPNTEHRDKKRRYGYVQ